MPSLKTRDLKRVKILFQELGASLDMLSVYRKLLQQEVMKNFRYLCYALQQHDKEQIPKRYSEFLFSLYETGTDDIAVYLKQAVLQDENCFNRHILQVPDYLERAVAFDLETLKNMAQVSAYQVKKAAAEVLPAGLPEWRNSTFSLQIKELKNYHIQNGYGVFAQHYVCSWREGLEGVDNPDTISLNELVGYQMQRDMVIKNTQALLEGKRSNNILLYGDRGTGKSSTVKAVFNHFRDQGLRLIELTVNQIHHFPEVLASLCPWLKYIIFIDDLAFETKDRDYTSAKALLEGSANALHQNVVVYATSNRRHLVSEYFADRGGEVHTSDSIEETLSLADRFGVTITFTSPSREEFYNIIYSMIDLEALSMTKEQVNSLAQKWEMLYNGRSARTAVQFVRALQSGNIEDYM